MKTNILTIIFLMLYSISNAQNQELDKRNGFKSLKLGTNIDQFQDLEITSKKKDETSAIWTPSIDSELNNLFNDKIDLFTLVFDKNKNLSKILIKLIVKGKNGDRTAKNKYDLIKGKMTSILGKPKTNPKNPNLVLWKGTKVKMYLSLKYETGKMNDEDKFITLHSIDVVILSSDGLKEKISKGF